MSREIEFAFWHKQKKEMWGVDSIDWRLREVCNGGDIASLDDGILLQYTGLKDKNGKKIFEGDLVQKIHKGKAYQVCEVKFNDGSFVVDDFDANGGKFFWSLRGMQHCWKVIGNVYKNSELMGGKNG